MYNLIYKAILSETETIKMQKLTPELTPYNDGFYLLLFLEIHKKCLNSMP